MEQSDLEIKLLSTAVEAFNAGYGAKKRQLKYCEDAREFVIQEWTGKDWLCLHREKGGTE